jgi:hypothetical protein
MAKITTTVTDKQNGKKQFSNGEIIQRPALNTFPASGTRNAAKPISSDILSRKRFVLLDQDGKIVATLIDQNLAEQWVSNHKKGVTRFVEGDPVVTH